MSKYHVVRFVDENHKVTVVPHNWVNNDGKECLWPPYKGPKKLQDAVKSFKQPEASWQKYRIELMKSTDSYKKALELEFKAMFTSDLNSEDEHERRVKPKKRKRTDICSYDSSSDEEKSKTLSDFPKLKVRETQNHPTVKTSHISEHTRTETHQNHQSSQSVSQPLKIARTPEQVFSPKPSSSISAHTSPQFLDNGLTPLRPKGQFSIEESFQKKVLRMMEAMKRDIREIKENLQSPHRISSLPRLPLCCPKLPCQNPEDLADLEKVLEDDETFNSICEVLSTIGGSNTKDTTRRILHQLISTNLALKYNWKGTRGVKLGFSIFTRIIKLILGAVRNNGLCPHATEMEVNDIIKKWLMHAKDRDGGRNIRAQVQNENAVQ